MGETRRWKDLGCRFPYGRAQARIEQATWERRKICRDSTGELGSRLLAYLPSRANDGLIEVLKRFRRRRNRSGFSNFSYRLIESPLEVTEEVIQATRRCWRPDGLLPIRLCLRWRFRQGHTARLRGTESNRHSDVLHFSVRIRGELCLVCPE